MNQQLAIKKKICMLGAFAVGKTSLVRRFVHSIFSDRYHTTVGVRIDKKPMVLDRQPLELILWDLYGEDDFQSVRMSYLKGAAGLIFVVDGSRGATLDTAMALWHRAEAAIGPTPAVVALNKWDLQDRWEIDDGSVQELRNGVDAPLLHTSAKTGQNVEAAFETLGRLMLTAHRDHKNRQGGQP